MADQVAHAAIAGGHSVEEPARRRFVIFAVVSIALLMSSVDQTIVATALPALQRELHAQVNWSSWTITIYALGQVLMMPLAGKLGDQFGRKQVFLTAAAMFTLASLCLLVTGPRRGPARWTSPAGCPEIALAPRPAR